MRRRFTRLAFLVQLKRWVNAQCSRGRHKIKVFIGRENHLIEIQAISVDHIAVLRHILLSCFVWDIHFPQFAKSRELEREGARFAVSSPLF